MNASDAAPIAQYAARQIKNDRVGCILQANLVVLDLPGCVLRDRGGVGCVHLCPSSVASSWRPSHSV